MIAIHPWQIMLVVPWDPLFQCSTVLWSLFTIFYPLRSNSFYSISMNRPFQYHRTSFYCALLGKSHYNFYRLFLKVGALQFLASQIMFHLNHFYSLVFLFSLLHFFHLDQSWYPKCWFRGLGVLSATCGNRCGLKNKK